MPKLSAKIIRNELEKNELWPIYWIYGSEQLKIRELTQRIKKTHLQSTDEKNISLNSEILDAEEHSAIHVLEAAQSLSLSREEKFILIRNAHKLKTPEDLEPLFMAPKGTPKEVQNVCVFISKDLDSRKKFSKTLIQKAAVIECDEVIENDKEAWIHYLAKRKELKITPEVVLSLRQIEPWSLDSIEQELEKISLTYSLDEERTDTDLNNTLSTTTTYKAQDFIDQFFTKNLKQSLTFVEQLANQPEESIPLLGLLSWNLKNFIAFECARKLKTRAPSHIHSYSLSKIQNWSKKWNFEELLDLEKNILELDFSLKQTQKSHQAGWSLLCLNSLK